MNLCGHSSLDRETADRGSCSLLHLQRQSSEIGGREALASASGCFSAVASEPPTMLAEKVWAQSFCIRGIPTHLRRGSDSAAGKWVAATHVRDRPVRMEPKRAPQQSDKRFLCSELLRNSAKPFALLAPKKCYEVLWDKELWHLAWSNQWHFIYITSNDTL